MAKKSRLGRLLADTGRAAADVAGQAAAKRAIRARDVLRRMGRTQFTCHCGCNRKWSDHRLMNAHFLRNYGGYWGGKAGHAMARKMGKKDNTRRMGRAGLHAFGHADDWGRQTPKARARPQGPESGHRSLRFLRHAAGHDSHIAKGARRHERAARLLDAGRGGRLSRRVRAAAPVRRAAEARAARHVRKGNEHRERAAALTALHPRRPVTPRPPRAASQNGSSKGRAPRASANGNGHESRPVPHLTHLKRQAAPARTSAPVSRPASSRTPNGTRPVRTWTTRSPR